MNEMSPFFFFFFLEARYGDSHLKSQHFSGRDRGIDVSWRPVWADLKELHIRARLLQSVLFETASHCFITGCS